MSYRTFFVSGHLDLTGREFDEHYVPLLDEAITRGCNFVVGDAAGCDTMTQHHLLESGVHPARVVVHYMFTSPRNYVGEWSTSSGYRSDKERDEAMTRNSDADIAWVRPDKRGRKSGTQKNLDRRAEFARAKRLAERATWEKGHIDECTDDGEPALRQEPRAWMSARAIPIPPGFRTRYDRAVREYYAVKEELLRLIHEAEFMGDITQNL